MSARKQRLLLLGLALVVLGLLALSLFDRWGHQGDVGPSGTSQTEGDLSAELPSLDEAEKNPAAAQGLAATEVDASREPAATEGSFVSSSEGKAIGGAQVSWTPTAPRLLASRWDWDEIDAEWLLASTTHAVSDERGQVEIQAPDLSAVLGSIVWVDRIGFEPGFEALDPTVDSLGGRRFELKRADGVRVLVVDASGEPVESAIVEQHGVALLTAGEAPAYAPLLFQRSRTTDASGACEVSRFPGTQALLARRRPDRTERIARIATWPGLHVVLSGLHC